MKTSADQMTLEEYVIETNRIDRLIELFEHLENDERGKRNRLPRKTKKYDRMIHDRGFVTKISENTIEWLRFTGEKIQLPLTKALCKELRVDDQLMMSLGSRNGIWHVIHLGAVYRATEDPRRTELARHQNDNCQIH